MVISIYQYSWSLYAYGLVNELGWNAIEASLAFTIFAYLSTFVQPFSGHLADTYGPRKLAVLSSALVALGFMLSSTAKAPSELYLYFGLGSLGVGTLYGIATASAVKWFTRRRGLATGLVTFGFGAGASVFNLLIQNMITTIGVRAAFLNVGILMLLILLPLSYFLRYPKMQTAVIEMRSVSIYRDYRPVEMLKTWQWYIIYLTFIATSTTALLLGAQLRFMAVEFNLPSDYLNILLVLFPLANGLSRIIAGQASDVVGREKAMVVFYSLLGITLVCLARLGFMPEFFVLMTVVASLLSGAPYAFYPSLIGDYYGARHVTTNYGITYTAKAWSGLVAGWMAGYLASTYGTYRVTLVVVAAITLLAALLSSPLVLRPPKMWAPSQA